MTLNLADQLVRRLATDPSFRQPLAALDPAAKRAFLDANGFRGVTADRLQSMACGTFKELSGGADKVADEDAMAAVTAAATAPAAASFIVILVSSGSTARPGRHPAAAVGTFKEMTGFKDEIVDEDAITAVTTATTAAAPAPAAAAMILILASSTATPGRHPAAAVGTVKEMTGFRDEVVDEDAITAVTTATPAPAAASMLAILASSGSTGRTQGPLHCVDGPVDLLH